MDAKHEKLLGTTKIFFPFLSETFKKLRDVNGRKKILIDPNDFSCLASKIIDCRLRNIRTRTSLDMNRTLNFDSYVQLGGGWGPNNLNNFTPTLNLVKLEGNYFLSMSKVSTLHC